MSGPWLLTFCRSVVQVRRISTKRTTVTVSAPCLLFVNSPVMGETTTQVLIEPSPRHHRTVRTTESSTSVCVPSEMITCSVHTLNMLQQLRLVVIMLNINSFCNFIFSLVLKRWNIHRVIFLFFHQNQIWPRTGKYCTLVDFGGNIIKKVTLVDGFICWWKFESRIFCYNLTLTLTIFYMGGRGGFICIFNYIKTSTSFWKTGKRESVGRVAAETWTNWHP